MQFSRGELGLAEKPELLRLGVGGAEIIMFVYICHCSLSGSAGGGTNSFNSSTYLTP